MLTRRRDIALLAAIYAHCEADRYVSFERLISLGIFHAGLNPWVAFLASRSLARGGWVKAGERSGKALPAILAPAGKAWFEDHAHYRRTGNRYRFEIVKGPTRFSGSPERRGIWAKALNRYIGLRYNIFSR